MSLSIRKLQKSFKQPHQVIPVLEGLSLEVKTGESVAILGPSGSGKSTFLSLVAGLDSPDSGDILIDGKSLTGLTESALTQFRSENIGIIFQQFHLVPHLTAYENVALPLQILNRPNIELKVNGILNYLGLKDRKDHLPLKLSGGECQRVAMARALVSEPKLLLADEPTGNLDTHTGEKATELLFKIIKDFQVTTLMVTHSLDLSKRCDRRFQLHNGVLEAQP